MKTKKIILITLLLAGICFTTQAQTKEERAKIMEGTDQAKLKNLEKEFQKKHDEDEKTVADYLVKNPTVKRSYTKRGSLYYLQRIDKDGKPIYIITRKIVHRRKHKKVKNMPKNKPFKHLRAN